MRQGVLMPERETSLRRMWLGGGDCPERLLIGFRNPDNSPRFHVLGWHPWPQAGDRDCAATMPFALGAGFGLSGYAQTGCSIVFAIPEGSQTASRGVDV